MLTVILNIRLELPSVFSLKEKRRILKSLITRLRNNFNISISEVDNNDVLRTATLGVAIVTNESSFGDKVIAKVVNKIEANPDLIVLEYHTERY
ncbi:MAG: DUF503 domain-containing protein [Candidatus Zixiibacteriota bacterium]|nr:MAG: DUF503 domain-containing protein [candidate division Zixibacteria bacterium]